MPDAAHEEVRLEAGLVCRGHELREHFQRIGHALSAGISNGVYPGGMADVAKLARC
jgi:hypothetical protein